jgi:hypothetical protein
LGAPACPHFSFEQGQVIGDGLFRQLEWTKVQELGESLAANLGAAALNTLQTEIRIGFRIDALVVYRAHQSSKLIDAFF